MKEIGLYTKGNRLLKKAVMLLFLSFAFAVCAEAKPNVFKEAANAIKNRKDLAKNRDALVAHANAEGTKQADRARAYAVAAEVSRCINMVENEKLYLKQAYDTTSFFSSIRDLYAFVLKCDSIERLPDAKGKVKIRYRKAGAQMLQTYRTNLLNGGKWHMRGGRYAEAYRFFDMYCSTVDTPVNTFANDTVAQKSAYWAVHCATATDNHNGTLKYVDTAMVLGLKNVHLQKYKVEALQALGDTAGWYFALETGMRNYTSDTYFFGTLMDYLRSRHEYDKAKAYAEEMIEREPDSTLYHYAYCQLFLDTEDWDRCIATANNVLLLDSTYADAFHNKGLCYVKKALAFAPKACLDLHDPMCAADRKYLQSLYNEARKALERYRALRPDRKDRWASPLYHIYLNLNMGKEFGEIEKLLKN